MPTVSPEANVVAATSLAAEAVKLLVEAERLHAVPYLRLAVAVLEQNETAEADPRNEAAMHYLRAALVLLERNGEDDAAGDVESALVHLGEPFPELSDVEANAKMDWWISREQSRFHS
jgi:hypothetical protein